MFCSGWSDGLRKTERTGQAPGRLTPQPCCDVFGRPDAVAEGHRVKLAGSLQYLEQIDDHR